MLDFRALIIPEWITQRFPENIWRSIMLEFDDLEQLCQQANLDFGAAECHGILSGLVCASRQPTLADWLALIYDCSQHALPPSSQHALWNQLYSDTLQQLQGGEFDFQPLLPNDDLALEWRTENLSDWCRGYLFGISAGNISAQSQQSDEIREIIMDISQISAAGYSADEDTEESETAYVELIEYIRAATLLIYNELHTAPPVSVLSDTIH